MSTDESNHVEPNDEELEEAAIAELLSGEVDRDSPEGQALLAASGLDPREFEELRHVADALELSGGAMDPEGDDLGVDVTGLLLEAAGMGAREDGPSAPDESPAPGPRSMGPQGGGLRLAWAAGAVAAAAAGLLLFVWGGKETPMDPGPGGMGARDLNPGGGELLGAGQGAVRPATLDAATRVLTIPVELQPADVLLLTIEEAAGDESWATLFEGESEESSVTLSVDLVGQIQGGEECRVRLVRESSSSSPESLPPLPLVVR